MNRQYAALNGIAMMLVVLNHTIHFGLLVSPVQGVSLGVLLALQSFGIFAVPIFLFVSGAFLSYASREVSLTFVRVNLARLLWPYVIWSAIFLVPAFLSGNLAAISVAGYLRNLLIGYPYNFVPLLVFWYATAVVLIGVAKRYPVLLLLSIAIYQVLLLALRFPEVFGTPGATQETLEVLKPPVLFTPLSDWAVYFPLGLVLGLHSGSARASLSKWRAWLLTATAGLFGLAVLSLLGVFSVSWARFVAPATLVLVLPLVDRAAIPWVRAFELLGRRSYGIYLTHLVILGFSVVVLSRLSLAGVIRLLVFPFLFVLALGGSLALMDAFARGARRLIYRHLFGVAPPPPVGRAGQVPLASLAAPRWSLLRHLKTRKLTRNAEASESIVPK